MDMTIQTLVPVLLAFFVGCIFIEIRWIGRMRKLRGKLGMAAATREDRRETANSESTAVARAMGWPLPDSPAPENTRGSLLALQQTLTGETVSTNAAVTSEHQNR